MCLLPGFCVTYRSDERLWEVSADRGHGFDPGRQAKVRAPNCRMAQLIASAIMPAVGESDGCSPEANSASHHDSVPVGWTTESLKIVAVLTVETAFLTRSAGPYGRIRHPHLQRHHPRHGRHGDSGQPLLADRGRDPRRLLPRQRPSSRNAPWPSSSPRPTRLTSAPRRCSSPTSSDRERQASADRGANQTLIALGPLSGGPYIARQQPSTWILCSTGAADHTSRQGPAPVRCRQRLRCRDLM